MLQPSLRFSCLALILFSSEGRFLSNLPKVLSHPPCERREYPRGIMWLTAFINTAICVSSVHNMVLINSLATIKDRALSSRQISRAKSLIDDRASQEQDQ